MVWWSLLETTPPLLTNTAFRRNSSKMTTVLRWSTSLAPEISVAIMTILVSSIWSGVVVWAGVVCVRGGGGLEQECVIHPP